MSPSQAYYDRLRLYDIISQIQYLKPDIVGLSEVWADRSKERFIRDLRDILPYSAWEHSNSPLQMGSGLLLLSKFPLSNISFTRYDYLVGDYWFRHRGFILVTAEIHWQKFLIVCTQLQSGNDEAAIIARKSNLLQLQYDISQAADASTPVILLGDLNIAAENQSGTPTGEYEFLSDTLKSLEMSDSYRTLNPTATSAPGYTYDAVNNKLIARFTPSDASNKVKERRDYLFVRGINPTSMTISNSFTFQPPDGTGTQDLSEHYPVEGEFSIW
jgi:endonuclease/exonuclease/phosphatase family metal-dependent hydrolase